MFSHVMLGVKDQETSRAFREDSKRYLAYLREPHSNKLCARYRPAK